MQFPQDGTLIRTFIGEIEPRIEARLVTLEKAKINSCRYEP